MSMHLRDMLHVHYNLGANYTGVFFSRTKHEWCVKVGKHPVVTQHGY